MVLLYGIPLGIVAGFLVGGRLSGLADLSLRWAPLAVIGLLAQVVLFLPSVTSWIGDLGPPLYVVSTVLVLIVVLRNVRTTGMPLVVAGAVSNLAAILANGGFMPASPEVYAAQGRAAAVGYSNTRLIAEPALALLTDRIALPSWLPLAHVVSIGDLLIMAGIAGVIAAAMRRRRRTRADGGRIGGVARPPV
jgi:hypothetical protein